jgi:hypothetical protein
MVKIIRVAHLNSAFNHMTKTALVAFATLGTVDRIGIDGVTNRFADNTANAAALPPDTKADD